MKQSKLRFAHHHERGQALVEYALIAVLLIISFGVAVRASGPVLGNVFCQVALNLVQGDTPDDLKAEYGQDPLTGEWGCRQTSGTPGEELAEMPSAEEFWLTVTWVAQQTPEDLPLPTRTLPPPTNTSVPGPTLEPTATIVSPTPIPSDTPEPSPTAVDFSFTAPWTDSANQEEFVHWRLDDSFYTGSEDWLGFYYNNGTLSSPEVDRLYNYQLPGQHRNKLEFDWGTGTPTTHVTNANGWSVSYRKPIWVNPDVTDKVTLNINIPQVDDGVRIWIYGGRYGGSDVVDSISGAGSCSGTGTTPGGPGVDFSSAPGRWTIYDDASLGYNPITDPAASAPTECLIVDGWVHNAGPSSLYNIKRTVPAGLYFIQVDYYDYQGDASLNVVINNSDLKINPDDTAVNNAGNPVAGSTTCGWYNRESSKLPDTLDYMWDEYADGAPFPPGNRCYLELRGSVLIPATMTDVKLTFWDIWDMRAGVSGWVEVGDYDAYLASGNRSSLNWTPISLHDGSTYNYNWTHNTVDLTSFVGKRVALRFGIQNNNSTEVNRWYLDTLRIDSTPRDTFYTSQRWQLNDAAEADDFITSGHWELTTESALGSGMAWHESPGRNSSAFTEYRNPVGETNDDVRVHSIEFNGIVDLNDARGISDLEGDTGNPMLTFWHKYLVNSHTGLEVQYTTDGVTADPNTSFGLGTVNWQPLPGDASLPAGGVLLDRTNSGAITNGQMTSTEISLQPLVDLGVTRFRLRFALIMRNDAVEDNGWWIDEIQLERTGGDRFLPYPFYDDVDDVTSIRDWEGDWGRVEGGHWPPAGSPGYSYTDTPGGNYNNNSLYNLVAKYAFDMFMDSPTNVRSSACSVSGCTTPDPTPIEPMLEFYWWRRIENNDDLFVEWRRASETDSDWRQLWAYVEGMQTRTTNTDRETRVQTTWERVEVNLKPMMDILTSEDIPGDPNDDDILIRFSFDTDGSNRSDGHYIDDIRMRERNTTAWRLWSPSTTPTDSNGNILGAGSGVVFYDGIDTTSDPDDQYWYIGGEWQSINWASRGGTSSFHDSPQGQASAPPFQDGSSISDPAFATAEDAFQVIELATWIDLRGVDAADVPMLDFWSRFAIGSNHKARVEVAYFEPDKYADDSLMNYCRNGYAQCYEKNYGWSEWNVVWQELSQRRTYTWQYERVDLSQFAKGGGTGEGRLIRIRFVLDSLYGGTEWDGWYIDEVRVEYNDPEVFVIDRDITEGSLFDRARNLRNWIPEGIWGISQTFGRGQSPTSGLGQLTWRREFVNLSDVGCPMGRGSTDRCADWYFDGTPLPNNSNSYSFVNFDNFIVYPDYQTMRAQPGAADLDSNYIAGRWRATTALVGPSSIGGQIEPGLYLFQTISDDGVRMRYEVASGPCTITATPDLPMAEDEWNMIDNWTYHGDQTDTGRALLESGCTYRFEMQWFESSGGETIIMTQGTSGNTSFTDSPEYGQTEAEDVGAVQRSNSSLMLDGVLDLTGAINPVVQYYTYYEQDWRGRSTVEVSTDGGFSWTQNGLMGAPPTGIWAGDWTADFFTGRNLDFDGSVNVPGLNRDYANVPVGTDIDYQFGSDELGRDFPAVSDTWGQDNVSIRFMRTFTLSQATTFVFETWADDGVRLWVDYDQNDPSCVDKGHSGEDTGGTNTDYDSPTFTGTCLLIDNWRNQGVNYRTVLRTIPAGTHTIWLDYYEATSSAVVGLRIYGTNSGVAFDDPTYYGNGMPDNVGEIPTEWIPKAHDLSLYAGAGNPYITLRFRFDRQNAIGPDEGNDFQSYNQSPFNFKESWWITDITIAEP
ncbi:MAG: hypothetical protein KC708_15565 [Anaerolineae bacterium]|nr:hypothetical protein [Anaerolineae bacterium]